jgi:hypothetical protein
MQYKVPQNVDIEDKVIAGLTLRQFMFLMVAGGAILIFKAILVGSVSFLFIPASVLVGGLGVALAFIKINDRPFEIFLVSAAKTLVTPNRRVWSKDIEVEAPHPETKKKIEAVQQKKSLGEIKSNLERLATIVDSGGAHETNVSDTHTTNVKQRDTNEPTHLNDVLAQTEQKPAELEKMLTQAREYVSKNAKEGTVSSIGATATKPADFKYDKIDVTDERQVKEILEKAKAKQKAKEEALASAKVEKFERN